MELLELADLDPAKGSSVKAAKLRMHAPEVLPVRGQFEVEWPQSASLAPLANQSDEHAHEDDGNSTDWAPEYPVVAINNAKTTYHRQYYAPNDSIRYRCHGPCAKECPARCHVHETLRSASIRMYRRTCLKVQQLKLPQVDGTDSEELAVQLLVGGFPEGDHWQQLFAKPVVMHDSAGIRNGDA